MQIVGGTLRVNKMFQKYQESLMIKQIKGVKIVCSTLHHRISNHLKRKSCGKIAFSLDLLSCVMLYSVWHHV